MARRLFICKKGDGPNLMLDTDQSSCCLDVRVETLDRKLLAHVIIEYWNGEVTVRTRNKAQFGCDPGYEIALVGREVLSTLL